MIDEVRRAGRRQWGVFAELLGVPISTYRNDEQHITETPPPVLKLAVIAASHPELIDGS